MKAWRVLFMLPLLLLNGCLVTLQSPLPSGGKAPSALLGTWSGRDGWGGERFLQVNQRSGGGYQLTSWRERRERGERQSFSVIEHQHRWFFSLPAPERLGGNQAFGSFELTADDELVIYSLDIDRLSTAIGSGQLEGELVSTEEGDGVLLDSPLDEVFAYLDDPANAGLLVEVARFSRVSPQDE